MESFISFCKMLLNGVTAIVLYVVSRDKAFTEVQKQEAEQALELELNASKAQEQIRRQADVLKKKIPNSWSSASSRLRSKALKG